MQNELIVYIERQCIRFNRLAEAKATSEDRGEYVQGLDAGRLCELDFVISDLCRIAGIKHPPHKTVTKQGIKFQLLDI